MKRWSVVLIVVICSIVTSATPAYAYLDPGSGSLLLQLLAGAAFGAAAAVGIFFRRIRSFCGRLFGRGR